MAFKYPFKAFLAYIALIILNGFNNTFAQAPNITYPSHSSSYPINSPIIPLSPTNSGGIVPATIYGRVKTIAGAGQQGFTDGPGSIATFTFPENLTIYNGVVYLTNNDKLRQITQDGAVSTIAGDGSMGYVNGIGTTTKFSTPEGIVADNSGNLYIADDDNSVIRKVTPTGVVSTFAGKGGFGYVDGSATQAMFIRPYGITIDAAGNFYVTDQDNYLVRKITPNGDVSTLAGNRNSGFANGIGINASFKFMSGIVIDKTGNLYVADEGNNMIRKITQAGLVTTFAGSGFAGTSDGPGLTASFTTPTALAIDDFDNLYVADHNNYSIRKITNNAVVSTLLTSVNAGGLATDHSGNLYFTDIPGNSFNILTLTGYTIDKPLPPGLIFNPTTGTISGTPTAKSPATPYIITAYNGSGSSQYTVIIAVGVNLGAAVQPPQFSYPTPQTYPTNLPITPLVPVTTGGAVPATLFGSVTTFAGKNNTTGYIDATGNAAEFINLWGIDKDAAGNLYVSDSIRVRKITPAGIVSTLAGGNPNSVSDGNGTAAGFNDIAGLAVAPSGNIFVGDLNNHVIRQITPGGAVSTFAGNGINSFNPVGVAVDQTGNVFVADQVNDLIRKFTPGAIGSIYSGGQGVAGSTNGNIASATFNNPADLEFDNSGNLFIADAGSNMIREISTTGLVSTVAGNTVPGLLNGPIATARFNKPSALALDAVNNIYIADSHNLLIRMINQLGQVVAVAGDNQIRLSRDGIGGSATFSNLSGLIYSNGSLFATDRTSVRKIIVTGYTIDKPLPQGLIFDSQTGIISGTPVNPSPATIYTITGYNEGGNYSTTVTITVIASIVTAPAIAYQTPQVYTTDTQIAPLTPTNSGSAATDYTIDKTLPAGLILNLATGIISGTPTTVSPATDYKITASNSGGSSSFTINITVVAKVLTPQTITFGPIPAKTYGDADFVPTASSTNNTIPVSYTSDNPAVATIVNGTIHITGAGTSNITASQPGNTDYADANPITRLLTVNKAILTVIAEDKTRVFGTFNPTLTVNYSGFVYNETAAQLTILPVLTTTAVETSPIGEYPISISGAASPNYIFNYAPGTLTITAVPATISIPNAFTPNGDGVNDEWNIKSLVDYPQSILSVYNRYGSLVYQSRGYPKPWDGTYHGSQVPVGTYYYIIDLKNGTSKLSGYVTVLR